MAVVVPTFLAMNTIGNLREDYFMVPATNTDTTPVMTSRLAVVMGAEVHANNGQNTSPSVTVSNRIVTLSTIDASREYRIKAWGW